MHQRAVVLLSLFVIPLLPGGSSLSFAADAIDMGRVMKTLDVRNCERYPYSDARPRQAALKRFRADLRRAINTGLQCLAGNGPMGKLHPYHEEQARRLQALLESEQTKTFLCVADEMYADAVATQKVPLPESDGLSDILKRVQHPAVVMDVYRIGGLLSRRYSEETYRQFFKLNENQIREHLTGSPLHLDNTHRYQNMSALLFHEMVHWLGHSHSYINPDVTTLYETCCFGGSDYISDDKLNKQYQAETCEILRDDELWSANNYQKVRLWHYKGYDQLKGRMREDAD
jgi:hypothetical protein